MPPLDESVVLVDGPWEHRTVSANGVRLHVAEAGSGPLVLLLHGFPGTWWSWRHQLPALAAAGLRAVAVDLRGHGASDKPPRGYDAETLAADVAGLVRALGERDAVVVGHDWGGLTAWGVAALHPSVVRALAVVSVPHPRRLAAALASPAQLRAARHLVAAQVPGLAESRLVARDGAGVARAVRAWGGPRWRRSAEAAEAAERHRRAALVPGVAHCALEHQRWTVRSLTRPSGLAYLRRTATRVPGPVLHVHGGADPVLLPASVAGSERFAVDYRFVLLPGVGHFPPEEAPDEVSALLVDLARG